MEVQGRSKRGRSKRSWLDRVRDDIKDKVLSREEVYRYMEAYIFKTSTTHKSGNKRKKICCRNMLQ